MFKKLSFLFITLCITLLTFSSVYCANVDMTRLKEGDVIYFDNSGTNWNSVKIYIFENNGNGLYDWNDSKSMTKINGTNIYKFVITSDLNINSKTCNMVIFRNGDGNGENNQTVDLAYMGSIYAFKVTGYDSNNNNKRSGYWYAYDKSELTSLVDKCDNYEEKYYTVDSWSSFSSALKEAKSILQNPDVRLESADSGQSGYKCKYLTALDKLKEAEKNLVIDKKILKDKIDELENFDTDGYTKETVDLLKEAINTANEKYNDNNITVEIIKEQIEALENAKANLVVDKTPLIDSLENLEEFLSSEDSKYYTKESLEKVKDSINKLKEKNNSDDTTVEDVKSTVKEAEEALSGIEIDKEILKSKIDELEALSKDGYTEDSVNALDNAIADANKKYNNELDLETIKDQLEALESAKDNLIVDKDPLLDKLEQLEEFLSNEDSKYYTKESLKHIEDSIKDIKEKNENATTTVEDVKSAVKQAEDALKGVVVDKEILKSKIDETKDFDTNGYTEDSINAFKNTITDAEEKYNDENLTVNDVKEQLKLLEDAITDLVVDKNPLTEKLEELEEFLNNEDTKYYSEESLQVLKDSVDNLKEKNDATDVTVDDVRSAVNQANSALNNLNVNNELLDELISKGNSIDFEKYTDETVKELKDIINQAEKLKDNDKLTIEDLKDIEEKINSAINALEIKKVEDEVSNTHSEDNVNAKNPNTGTNTFYLVILFAISTIIYIIATKYNKRINNNN